MKMKLLTLAALTLMTQFAWGQYLLYNNGATVKIQSGATLYVEGGVHNTPTGTFDNDGTLEIKGDFLNEGTWDAATPNTLKFSGNTPSTLTSAPGIVYQDLVVQKAGANVVLASHTTVNDSLVFSSTGAGKIESAGFDLKLGSSAQVGGHDMDEYVAQTGAGMMEKAVTANGTFLFPVGDATNYSPIQSAHTGTGYASANIRTHVNNMAHPSIPGDATDYLTRYWDVTATGITNYENTLTGTYVPADDQVGMAGLTKGAIHDGTEWSYFASANGGNTVIGSTQDANVDFTGTNFYGKVDLKVFLQGAYSATTHLMSTTLTSNPTIEALMLNSPYTDAPASVADIPTGVTDWIKIELRDPAAPLTVLGRTSAFLKNDGSIVGLDGNSLPSIKNGLPVSIVGIVHRTHLSIRTPNTGIDVVSPSLHDFSTSLANAFDNPSNSTNDAMRLMSDGAYVMWAGNGNSNTNVRFGGPANDRDYLLGTILGGNATTVLSNVYSTGDYNMNGVVRFGGPANDRDFLLGTVLINNATNVWTQHY